MDKLLQEYSNRRSKHIMKIDHIEERGLDELAFVKRPLHTDHRFKGKDNTTFPDRMNLAGEAECFQILQKIIGENAERLQVRKFVSPET